MIVVLPVCNKDLSAALRNLKWAKHLDGQIDYDCVVSHDTDTDAVKVISSASEYFKSVTEHTYAPPKETTWPRPQNVAFQHAASFVYGFTRSPWLWWEQDAVPLRSGWMDEITSEYLASRRLFMGAKYMTPYGPHLNGVAVYPYNVPLIEPEMMMCRGAPFDLVGGKKVLSYSHISPLFQHVWSFEGSSNESPAPTFPNAEDLLKVDPKAVLFHRCKDDSLIRRMLKPKEFAAICESLQVKIEPVRRFNLSIGPKNKQKIPITAHLDGSSGYGTFSTQVISELLKRKYVVESRSPSMHESDGPIAESVKKTVSNEPINHPWELVIFPCVIQPTNLVMGKHDIAYLTMWESTRLTSKIDKTRMNAVSTMNNCKVVMVPNAWNASTFSSCGVDTPIRIVPLGSDLKPFKLVENLVEREIFVFGTAARTRSGGIRKGFNTVLEAFKTAFPNEPNVRLRVKCFHDDPEMDTGGDSRIDVVRACLTVQELAKWYKSLNVFASGSASEGWGRHQQEAMCMGRPVIGINFGGVTAFFNEDNGYACDWTLEPGEGIYETMGHYAKPTVKSMADCMRWAFEDRVTLNRKVNLSAASARRFTIEHSVDKIIDVLKEFGMLK